MVWTTKLHFFLPFSLPTKSIHKTWDDQNKDGETKTILQFIETGIGDTVSWSSEMIMTLSHTKCQKLNHSYGKVAAIADPGEQQFITAGGKKRRNADVVVTTLF